MLRCAMKESTALTVGDFWNWFIDFDYGDYKILYDGNKNKRTRKFKNPRRYIKNTAEKTFCFAAKKVK